MPNVSWNLRPWYAVDGSAIEGKRPFDQSNVPESTTAPAIVVPFPAMNFVAEWMIRSAPNSSGRHRYGVAKVLSTMSGAPTSCATAAAREDVENVAARIRDRLGEERLRLGRDGAAPTVRIV